MKTEKNMVGQHPVRNRKDLRGDKWTQNNGVTLQQKSWRNNQVTSKWYNMRVSMLENDKINNH